MRPGSFDIYAWHDTDRLSPEINLDTVYDANVLEDHRGPQFARHQGARIRQKEILDINKGLIVPWKVPTEFREGTLVYAVVRLRMWNVPARNEGNGHDHVGPLLVQHGRS